MNNGLKALLLAAATIITCIIVELGFRMAREAKQIGNYAVEELHSYRTAAEERSLTRYDGVVVYGGDVINLMKKELQATENGFQVTVVDGKTRVSYTVSADIEKAQETTGAAYVAPLAEYLGKVIRNENKVIVEIIFTKKSEKENT